MRTLLRRFQSYVLAAGLLIPCTAHADPPVPVASIPAAPEPSNGLLLILAGSGLTVGGVADLVTAPLCRLSAIRESAQPACIGTSVGVGVALLAAGIPLAVLGANKRGAWNDWQKLRVEPTKTGGVATMTWTF